MKIDPDALERILLVRLSALGDCVASIPILLALRERFPKAHIAWAVQDNNAPLLRNLSQLDEIIVFPRARWRKAGWRQIFREGRRLIRHLRMRRFDLAIDAQSNSKSSALAWLSGAPIRIGHGGEEAREISAWLNNVRVAPPPGVDHIVRRNLQLLSPLGIEASEPRFSLPRDEASHRRILSWMNSQGVTPGEAILLVPFCGRPEKEWPSQRFSELAALLAKAGDHVIVQSAPGREKESRAIAEAANHKNVHISPQTTIPELVELIRNSRRAVGGDTGPIQIAGAIGIPSISLFGPTDPKRLRPWSHCAVLPLESDPKAVANALSNPEASSDGEIG